MISNIPIAQTEHCPQMIVDYLAQKLMHLQTYPADIQQAFAFAQQHDFPMEKRQSLHEVLQQQHTDPSPLQQQNTQKILQPNTYTVCTGHQLNLGLGPAFSIYKILQVIKTCDQLNQKNQQHFVPVFWMASEDHDFEEISFFKVDEQRFAQDIPQQKTAVGRLNITHNEFLTDLEKSLLGFPFADELMSIFKKAYQTEHNYAQANRILLQHLFADFGLLILDADHPQLKTSMKKEFAQEILQQNVIHQTKSACDFIQQQYGKLQVNPRDINLFYLKDQRQRLVKDGQNYKVLDSEISFTEAEILAEIDTHPEHFSPNAILRPLYQQQILPNAIYIGGNAEIMYWLQLKAAFEAQNIAFPVLIPRNSVLLLEDKITQKQQKLPLTYAQYFKDFEAHQQQILSQDQAICQALQASKIALTQEMQKLQDLKMHSLQSFEQMLAAEHQRQQNSLERLEKRWLKAEKIKQKELVQRLQAMKAALNPKIWQERQVNFTQFYRFHGANWLQYCYNLIETENSSLIIARNSSE